MQRHPLIGAEILRPLRLGKIVGPIVRGHHERWDGAGYPDGLRGDAIPIGARIVSVVDAYDAMTHDRPYRSRLTEDEAREELRRHRGTQFDGDLVDLLLASLDGSLTSIDGDRCVHPGHFVPRGATDEPAITLIIELLFVALFVATLVSYLRRRDALSRDVMLIFASLAGLFLVAGVGALFGTLPGPVIGVALALLLAQPLFTLRLANRLHPIRGACARRGDRGLGDHLLPLIVLPLPRSLRWSLVGARGLRRHAPGGRGLPRHRGAPSIRLRSTAARLCGRREPAHGAGPRRVDTAFRAGAVTSAPTSGASSASWPPSSTSFAFLPPAWARTSEARSRPSSSPSTCWTARSTRARRASGSAWPTSAGARRLHRRVHRGRRAAGDRGAGDGRRTTRPMRSRPLTWRRFRESSMSDARPTIPEDRLARLARAPGRRTSRSCRSTWPAATRARWSCCASDRACSPPMTMRILTALIGRARVFAERNEAMKQEAALAQRLSATVAGARAGRPGQERLPGQHEPRAADAAQRDHRLLRAHARRAARR